MLGSQWFPFPLQGILSCRKDGQSGSVSLKDSPHGPKALIISGEGGQLGNNSLDTVGWLLASVMFLDD